MDRSQALAQGSIPRLLLTFSLPAIVGMMAQALYNIVDRIFVGQALGPNGIAGTTVAFPAMLVLLAFGMLIGFGAAALISIRLGQHKREEAEQVLGNAVVLLVVVSLAATVGGLCFLDPLLRIFGASEQVLPYARDYLGIIVLGTTFQIVGFGLNASIRGEGNPRIAMFTLLIGVLLNVALAPVFVFGLRWGMKGAALATVIAQAVSATWVVAHFLGGRSVLKLRWQNLRLDRAIYGKILMMGSPLFCMQMAASVMNSILNNQLRSHGGDLAISVFGIIYSLFMVTAMPIFGINQGAQPIIGYNYGAGSFDRVRRTLLTAVLAASCITVAGFVVAHLIPVQVVRLFSRGDPELVALGSHALRICTVLLPLAGFQIVSAGYFQAVGKPKQALVMALSRQFLLLIPAVVILPMFFGLDGVWAAMPTADVGSSLLTGTCLFWELRHLGREGSNLLALESVLGPDTCVMPDTCIAPGNAEALREIKKQYELKICLK
jgi:putative MATE family efflux protein